MILTTIKRSLIVFIRLLFPPQIGFKEFYKRKNNKLLIVSCIGIGNTILSIPLIMTVLKNFKYFQVDILTNDIASYNIIRRLDIVKNVFWLGNTPWMYLKIINRLRRIQYQYSLVTFPSLSLPIEIIPILVGSRNNIIHDYRPFNKNINNIIESYQAIIPINQEIHDTEQNINLLSGINYRANPNKYYPKYWLTKKDIIYLEIFKKSNSITKNNKILLIHPGSKEINNHKRWPLEKYLILAKTMMKERDIQVFFIIGPDEIDIIPILIENQIKYIENISILQLMAIIKISSLLITNDSGIMHLASLVDIPIIAIWGATNINRNSAVSDKAINISNKKVSCRPCINIIPAKNRKCSYECIRDITVDEVIQNVKQVLNEKL